MRHITIDDTCWPVDDDGELQWALRYRAIPLTREESLGAASALSAYAYLTDPGLPQYAAIEALKRARRAASGMTSASEPLPNPRLQNMVTEVSGPLRPSTGEDT